MKTAGIHLSGKTIPSFFGKMDFVCANHSYDKLFPFTKRQISTRFYDPVTTLMWPDTEDLERDNFDALQAGFVERHNLWLRKPDGERVLAWSKNGIQKWVVDIRDPNYQLWFVNNLLKKGADGFVLDWMGAPDGAWYGANGSQISFSREWRDAQGRILAMARLKHRPKVIIGNGRHTHFQGAEGRIFENMLTSENPSWEHRNHIREWKTAYPQSGGVGSIIIVHTDRAHALEMSQEDFGREDIYLAVTEEAGKWELNAPVEGIHTL